MTYAILALDLRLQLVGRRLRQALLGHRRLSCISGHVRRHAARLAARRLQFDCVMGTHLVVVRVEEIGASKCRLRLPLIVAARASRRPDGVGGAQGRVCTPATRHGTRLMVVMGRGEVELVLVLLVGDMLVVVMVVIRVIWVLLVLS